MEDIARMDLRAITLDEEPIPPVPAQVVITNNFFLFLKEFNNRLYKISNQH